MNKKLIEMFHLEIADKSCEGNFKKVNEQAIKCGYIVHPDCCTRDVEEWIKEQTFNPNSTFYKNWSDVTSKNRLELAFDQILHYVTTYGTNFAAGNGYVPNGEPAVIPYETYKVILPASVEDVFEKCYGMFKSGIALKPETINLLLEFIEGTGMLENLDVNQIANREAQAIVCNKIGIYPIDPVGLLRVIVYNYTGSAMLIKSKEVIEAIRKEACGRFNLSNLSDSRIKDLSKIFYRFKPLFLAMKAFKPNAKVVNKIRKLSEKNHIPMQAGFWENVLSAKNALERNSKLEKAKKLVNELTNYKKVCLMQGIKYRINSDNDNGKMYVVRNGKVFYRKDYKAPCDVEYLLKLYLILKDSLVESIKGKATTYKIPDAVSLAVPSSEKSFVGNYPFGTTVSMGTDHNIVGIYWRDEWGVRDYDLSYTTSTGMRLGWNSWYYSDEKDIVYSGDMTSADPEATENFFIDKAADEGFLVVNKYWGLNNSQLKLFVGTSDKPLSRGIMLDPNDIKFEAIIPHEGMGEKYVAYIHNNKVMLMDLTGAARRVSNTEANEIKQQALAAKADSFVDLKEILDLAGFKEVGKDEEAELDFTNPSKDDLIKLFTIEKNDPKVVFVDEVSCSKESLDAISEYVLTGKGPFKDTTK